MQSNVDYLPIWKKNATVADRLYELAMMAEKNPDRFEKLAVIYQENNTEKGTFTRWVSAGCNTNELIGIIHIGLLHIYEDTHK